MTTSFMCLDTLSALEQYYIEEFEAAATGCGEIIIDQLLTSQLFCSRSECGCNNMVFRNRDDIVGVRGFPHPILAVCQVELREKLQSETPYGASRLSSLQAAWDEIQARVLSNERAGVQFRPRDDRLVGQVFDLLRPDWSLSYLARRQRKAAA